MSLMVVGFAFDAIGRLLLIKKNKPTWMAGLLNGVGGKVEFGETAVEAMVREFEEDAGIRTTTSAWTPKVHLTGKEFCVYFFTANLKDFSGLKQMTDERLELHFPHEIVNISVLPNLKWLIPLVQDPNLCFPITIYDKTSFER